MPKKYKHIMVFLFNCMKNEDNVDLKGQCIDIVEEIIRIIATDEVLEQGRWRRKIHPLLIVVVHRPAVPI